MTVGYVLGIIMGGLIASTVWAANTDWHYEIDAYGVCLTTAQRMCTSVPSVPYRNLERCLSQNFFRCAEVDR